MTFRFAASASMLALAAVLAGCSGSTTSEPPPVTPVADNSAATLATRHWDLVEWPGQTLPSGKTPRLDFDAAKGRFSSSTPCNGVMGAYEVKGQTIRFGGEKGRLASTMMACPEPAMSLERAYSEALSATTGFSLAGDRLTLTGAAAGPLVFQAAHKPPADAPRKLVYVSAETKPCTGVAPMTCLQIREDKTGPWQLHYSGIEGFEPQPGIEYRLRVIEETIPNPPADGSSIRWTLDQVIEQRVVEPGK